VTAGKSHSRNGLGMRFATSFLEIRKTRFARSGLELLFANYLACALKHQTNSGLTAVVLKDGLLTFTLESATLFAPESQSMRTNLIEYSNASSAKRPIFFKIRKSCLLSSTAVGKKAAKACSDTSVVFGAPG
jgi:hypothetical protein